LEPIVPDNAEFDATAWKTGQIAEMRAPTVHAARGAPPRGNVRLIATLET
jgi:hypothetical protein